MSQDTLFLHNQEEKGEDKKMNIYEKLSNIQNEMNVPKNLFNKFGNYSYRNAETILESAKPICKKYKTTLTVDDEIILIGERYYVRAMAKLFDWDSGEIIANTALAREEETKKGMDGSQITGSASSYARKYALNGLFNLDDVKDADTNEQAEQLKNKQENKPEAKANESQISIIADFCNSNAKFVDYMKSKVGDRQPKDLTLKEASELIKAINTKKNG